MFKITKAHRATFCLIILILLFMTVSGLQAQTPCNWTGNCTGANSQWVDEDAPLLVDTNQCSALIYYRWRECEDTPPNPPKRQIEVKEIVLVNGGNCQNTSTSAIINKSVQTIISLSFGLFSSYSSEYNLTIKIPSCSKITPSNIYTGYSSISNKNCSTGCCEATYTVIHEDGQTMVSNDPAPSYPVNNDNCEATTGESCYKYCNDMVVPQDVPLYPYSYPPLPSCMEYCNNGPYTTVSKSSFIASEIENIGRIKYIVFYKLIKCSSANDPQAYVVIEHIQVLNDPNYGKYEFTRHAYMHSFRKLLEEGDIDYSRWLRAITPVCWGEVRDAEQEQKLVSVFPCDFSECCYRDLQFFFDVPDYKIEDDPVRYPVFGTNYSECGLSCTNYCGEIPGRILVNEFTYGAGVLPKISVQTQTKVEYINLYPNPSNLALNIEYGFEYTGDTEMFIYNVSGQEVIRKKIYKSKYDIKEIVDITNFETGVYFYKIIFDNSYKSGNFIISK